MFTGRQCSHVLLMLLWVAGGGLVSHAECAGVCPLDLSRVY